MDGYERQYREIYFTKISKQRACSDNLDSSLLCISAGSQWNSIAVMEKIAKSMLLGLYTK